MDFFSAFTPMYIFIGLYLLKAFFLKGSNDGVKCLLAFSGLFLSLVVETLFDWENDNNSSLCMLAIPISLILVSQSFLDLWFYKRTTDVKKRVFYGLDTTWKCFTVYLNSTLTIAYCCWMTYWLYVVQYNQDNLQGFKEDAKAVNCALTIFIIYSMCLVERVGSYVLDTLHQQFEFDLMR